MEIRNRNENYKKLAEELIETEAELDYIEQSNVKIAYLESDQCKKKGDGIVHGECEKIPAKYRWAIPEDFSITLFFNNNIGLSEKQIKILLFHELLHIGIDYGENGEVYKIVPHDVEDFKLIINRFGLDWVNKGEENDTNLNA